MNTIKVKAINGEIFVGKVIREERDGFIIVDMGMSEIRVHRSELVA